MNKAVHVELLAMFLALPVPCPFVGQNEGLEIAVTSAAQDTTSCIPRTVAKVDFGKDMMFGQYLFLCLALGTLTSHGLYHSYWGWG